MEKIKLITLGLGLLAWFLCGYLPGRMVPIEKGKVYAIGIGKNIFFYIKISIRIRNK